MSLTSPLAITEKEWEAQLIGTPSKPGLARTLGWTKCHHSRSDKRGRGAGQEASGVPDWMLVRDRVIFLELKTEQGKVSAAQAEWISALHKAQAEVYVVRPRHLEEIAFVLQRRYNPFLYLGNIPSLRAELESVLESR